VPPLPAAELHPPRPRFEIKETESTLNSALATSVAALRHRHRRASFQGKKRSVCAALESGKDG
jgi:hypothetical protein